jgi:ubiquinone/menaquinone biosynthesis C-methylase UbiE
MQAAVAQGVTNLATRVMDGEHLEVPDNTYDAVLSRVGLIYFPDQQRALAEMRRVLRPGGLVAAMVYATAPQNPFFSIPVGIIRRRAHLPPPAPGQPGPFSLGGDGVLAEAYRQAGFRKIVIESIAAPVHMASVQEFVQFVRDSFGALHQMMAGFSDVERAETWVEIERELSQFEGPRGFTGPCEMIVGVGSK